MWANFCQMNSGGSFSPDPGYGVSVECDTIEEGCRIAESVGVYFDGVRKGKDCRCCGDRWHVPWELTEEPEILSSSLSRGLGWLIVHRDGTREIR